MSATTATRLGRDSSTPAYRLRARDPGALSEAYQAHGERLFDYAMGVLGNREAAEDAVHDALLVAAHRIDTLARPDDLPLWLYALTRNECLRQVGRGRRAPEPATQVTPADPGPDEFTVQARSWVQGAAAALLLPIEREALDLASRHGLTSSEVALVLGVGPKRAGALIRAASAALERSLDVLLTIRSGHECAGLAELRLEWDGWPDAALCDRIGRHKAGCRACAPVTWDSVGAVDLFGEIEAAIPPRLLERRLLATAAVPSRVASRADIAEPFDSSGYPVPLDSRHRRRPIAIAVGLVAMAAVAAAVLYVVQPDPSATMVEAGRTSVGLPDATLGAPPPSADVSAGPAAEQPGAPASAAAVLPGAAATPSVLPSAPAPTPAPTRARPPTAASADAPTPSAAPQVDATMTDATVGCGTWWKATATATVRGAIARTVTLHWGVSTAASHAVPMQLIREGRYQAGPDDLPMNATIYWYVEVATTDGRTIQTDGDTIEHDSQCVGP